MSLLDGGAYVTALTRPPFAGFAPWALCAEAERIIAVFLAGLDNTWRVRGGIAVHETSTVESSVTLKPPCFIGPSCFIGAGVYLRGGVFLADRVTIGPSVEVKSSFAFAGARLAHLGFIGDSVIGADVNIEAGAVLANRWNERADKRILVTVDGRSIDTGLEKFGALVGDRSCIGANAVLSPGTLLPPDSIVPRLALVDQRAT